MTGSLFLKNIPCIGYGVMRHGGGRELEFQKPNFCSFDFFSSPGLEDNEQRMGIGNGLSRGRCVFLLLLKSAVFMGGGHWESRMMTVLFVSLRFVLFFIFNGR